ncbi:cytochrome c oxidase subunit 4 [Nakamurella sp. YIM 132087]|uniref:Cytochrome c oxidase polypeptide 4 n=1 Tax=Nakamurella alba TaxID=2665158 RepID=A0A7K1FT66_9ACTN|nr:cytochrome c oxidase subunit 4 [Nakamurella alba]
MRVEAWIFLALTVFFAFAAVLYGILAGDVEPVGVVALALTAGLSLIIGTFLLFSARRLDQARPEDDDDADVADGAGELGFFSPGSYWPFGMALAAAFTAVATAFLLVWLMVITIGFLMMAICGLLFEYHRRPQSH